MRTGRTTRACTVLGACVAALVTTAQPSAAAPPGVAPPDTVVGGYSVRAAAQAVLPAFFDACDREQLPRLPFRPVCARRVAIAEGGGFLFSGHADVRVRAGRYLFTVLGDVTNGDPVLGTFPRKPPAALEHWFGEDQLSGDRGTVTIDGVTTTLSSRALVGPFAVTLSDGGTRDVALATFLGPLSIGVHHVRTETTVGGPLIQETYGADFIRFVNDVTTTVVP